LANPIVAIALGSNVGDRRAHLDFAVSKLRTLLADLNVSRYYETVPVGMRHPQAMFLNAAAVGTAALAPGELLGALLAIERARGRERPYANAPRTLDLDLVLFGDTVIEEPDLRVPHPRFRERLFVLQPLAEIGAALRDPVTGRTVGELLRQMSGRSG
jgi:2-amino-4-hydroxy-6-hydroxymethyldihydropteridine diphosphokinase